MGSESTLSITIKWKGKTLTSLAIPTTSTFKSLKSTIQEISGVEAPNQKLLFKGKIMKDDETMLEQGIRDGDALIMMGTPSEAIPKSNIISSAAVGTVADSSNNIDAKTAFPSQPIGLVNLGNTCYLNSTMQSLRAVDALVTLLRDCEGPESTLIRSIKALNDDFDKQSDVIYPVLLLNNFHKRFPHMAMKNEQGILAQQDAEECLSLLINEISLSIPGAKGLFEGEFQGTLQCAESGEEEKFTESFHKLNCHISQETGGLVEGLCSGLQEDLTKHSAKLDRNANFTKTLKIANFPPYMIVNFIRFFWKPKEQIKAKILKKVPFPLLLDLEKLSVSSSAVGNPKYELVSVITHIGRSADSGHYISWTKHSPTGHWWKFDDDKVSPVKEDEIKKLEGGGDWHTAYLCVYKQLSN